MQIEKHGYTFEVETQPDEHMQAPWKEHDGHGPVSDWRPEDSKRPEERILHQDRSSCLFYDWDEAVQIAKRDGWGTADGRQPGETAGAYAVRAVQADYDYLARYCRGDWSYVDVIVTLLDEDGRPTEEREVLGAVENIDTKYVLEVANDLIDEILARIEVAQPDVVLSEN